MQPAYSDGPLPCCRRLAHTRGRPWWEQHEEVCQKTAGRFFWVFLRKGLLREFPWLRSLPPL